MTPHTASISDVTFAANFERVLEEKGLHGALRVLNATTPYRLTGIYRFQEGLVRSVVLFDRKNPELTVGVDVPWNDSYCRLVAEDGRRCEIADSLTDVRLRSHAARGAVQAYVAVLLKTPDGAPLGTLCHYDLQPVEPPADIFDALERVAPVLERALWRLLNLAHITEAERAPARAVGAAPSRLLQFHPVRRQRR
jgi:hypothetical protein